MVEELPAVERDDRDPLQVTQQQLRVLLDVAFPELERQPLADAQQGRAGVVAQVAAGAAVERDGPHGWNGRELAIVARRCRGPRAVTRKRCGPGASARRASA